MVAYIGFNLKIKISKLLILGVWRTLPSPHPCTILLSNVYALLIHEISLSPRGSRSHRLCYRKKSIINSIFL